MAIYRRLALVATVISLGFMAGRAFPDPFFGGLSPTAPSSPAASAALAPVAPPGPAQRIAGSLEAGVLIVVSKASQRMEVFRHGEPWLTSAVSTGRSGHRTPAGVFPIMEKRRFHRSNLYSNAPMPFMQRLTRSGIAIHAGRLPGYPASHGCIRVPTSVARALFELTSTGDTTVVIVNQAIRSPDEARQLALAWPGPPVSPGPPASPGLVPAPVLAHAGLPQPPVPPSPIVGPRPIAGAGQTIQLAAAPSPAEAEAHWSRLLDRHAELARFNKSVIPVLIGTRRFFRLRATGPGAFASCAQLKSAGTDCFNVL